MKRNSVERRKMTLTFIKILTAIMLFSPLWPMDVDPQPGEPYLMVNKATNQLGWVEEGSLVAVYNVATGKEPSDTPEGVFTVIVKIEHPYYQAKDIKGGAPDNPLGSRWIGFDADDTNGRTFGVHGTNKDESIGSHVSLGCIRMHDDQINVLYDRVSIGTKVWIGSEEDKRMIEIAEESGVLY